MVGTSYATCAVTGYPCFQMFLAQPSHLLDNTIRSAGKVFWENVPNAVVEHILEGRKVNVFGNYSFHAGCNVSNFKVISYDNFA